MFRLYTVIHKGQISNIRTLKDWVAYISTVLYNHLHCIVFHQFLVITILNTKVTENVTKVREQTSKRPFSPNFKAVTFSRLHKAVIFSKIQSGHFLQIPQNFIFCQAIVPIATVLFIGFNDRDSAPSVT